MTQHCFKSASEVSVAIILSEQIKIICTKSAIYLILSYLFLSSNYLLVRLHLTQIRFIFSLTFSLTDKKAPFFLHVHEKKQFTFKVQLISAGWQHRQHKQLPRAPSAGGDFSNPSKKIHK